MIRDNRLKTTPGLQFIDLRQTINTIDDAQVEIDIAKFLEIH